MLNMYFKKFELKMIIDYMKYLKAEGKRKKELSTQNGTIDPSLQDELKNWQKQSQTPGADDIDIYDPNWRQARNA